jgi:hypothetical protein
VEDVIHKAIQSDKSGHLAGLGCGGKELFGGLFSHEGNGMVE